eukprot:gene28664-31841_t
MRSVEDHVRSLEGLLDELERNEKTLDSKIDKKKVELERNEKRLSTLQSVRPAYMDEYERLQGELNDLYGKDNDSFQHALECAACLYVDEYEHLQGELNELSGKVRTEQDEQD